jgi:hypothetical protein
MPGKGKRYKTNNYLTSVLKGKWSVKLNDKIKSGTRLYVRVRPLNYVVEFKKKDNESFSYYWWSAIWKETAKVVRASENANLKSLRLSTGKLSLKFKKNRTWYRAKIASGKNSVMIKAKEASSYAKLQMKIGTKGKYKVVDNIRVKLRKGQSRNVFIRVTAQDGKTRKIYVINVTRKRW